MRWVTWVRQSSTLSSNLIRFPRSRSTLQRIGICNAGPYRSLTRSPFNTLQAAFRSSCREWRDAVC